MKPLDRNLMAMPDVQGSFDDRRIAIDQVGIRNLRHPLFIDGGNGPQPTVAQVTMAVALPHDQKGTHMSRFVALLNEYGEALTLAGFEALLRDMTDRLEARHGMITLTFPYFIRKKAPISGIESFLDYETTLHGECKEGQTTLQLKMVVPVKSLCPCSKEISQYGAHNQRSHITVTVQFQSAVSFDELAQLVEQQGSCEIFGLLKRADEKYVTERAYENPKFVEDIVRDVANALQRDERIRNYRVEVENFESIHNHSAYAILERWT